MIGHVGTKVSALVDGQLPSAEADRLWAHVHVCPLCRAEVEREGWVKTRLAGLALTGEQPAPPGHLAGSLRVTALGWPEPETVAESHERRRLVAAAIGVGSMGAAFLGVLAMTVPAQAPGVERRPATSLSRPTESQADRHLQHPDGPLPAARLHHLRAAGPDRRARVEVSENLPVNDQQTPGSDQPADQPEQRPEQAEVEHTLPIPPYQPAAARPPAVPAGSAVLRPQPARPVRPRPRAVRRLRRRRCRSRRPPVTSAATAGQKSVLPLVAAVALVVGLVGGALGGVAVEKWNDANQEPGRTSSGLAGVDTVAKAPLPADNGSIASVAQKLLPSTVQIVADFEGQDGGATGSGFYLDKQGHVVTNNHVVQDAAEKNGNIEVIDHEGHRYKATVVGRSKVYDLAVLYLKDAPGRDARVARHVDQPADR